MAEIRANGAHDANGSANWCTWRKLVQMVLMMQLVVQIGANGEHGANVANLCKWCTRCKWCKLVHNGAPFLKITMHQITHWYKSLVLVCLTTCINMSNI